ncbi:hypothetical protein [Mycoplasmopsis primatum]|uniref:hypothetical protein n=1 Tax=Mycoplasmopsis primatum TaxID=55604 RepID=UPI000496F593|nr:hypothetical protein [Mycoplasmopsis primatum]
MTFASLIDNNDYTKKQAELIYKGLKKGLDVSYYSDPAFRYAQMFWIYQGLRDGLDVNLYAHQNIHHKAMKEIYFNLKRDKIKQEKQAIRLSKRFIK